MAKFLALSAVAASPDFRFIRLRQLLDKQWPFGAA
jgi:hypothetical protein